jgi:hypothetical protein
VKERDDQESESKIWERKEAYGEGWDGGADKIR